MCQLGRRSFRRCTPAAPRRSDTTERGMPIGSREPPRTPATHRPKAHTCSPPPSHRPHLGNTSMLASNSSSICPCSAPGDLRTASLTATARHRRLTDPSGSPPETILTRTRQRRGETSLRRRGWGTLARRFYRLLPSRRSTLSQCSPASVSPRAGHVFATPDDAGERRTHQRRPPRMMCVP
jgi:hypothetical protein